MQKSDPIGTIDKVLGRTTMCVAAIRELWARPKNGDAFAVHSIVNETEPDAPWYEVYVTDYRGRRYDMCDLTHESQHELCDFVCMAVYGSEPANEHRINERYSYTEERDVQGRVFYDLWDNSRMHGKGSLRGPICVKTSYSLSEVVCIT